MEVKKYIFLSTEGITFQPNSELVEPDVENIQVIGFANGGNSKDAFKRLLKENEYLLGTTFDEVFSYELVSNYMKTKHIYHLSDIK